ncbi:MAG: signal peptidase II [Myxococcales bacterium]|nr:signal peptidase II [Myxococcales bacterium]
MRWLKEKYGVLILGLTVSLVLDQLTKMLVIFQLPKHAGRAIIPGIFDLYHVHNTGSAFSLFRDNPVTFFLIVNLAAIGFILYFFAKLERGELRLAAAFSLIMGGALGNLLDRLRHGFVIDFFRLHFNDLSWPVFNVADIAIFSGVCLFALNLIRSELQLRKSQGA